MKMRYEAGSIEFKPTKIIAVARNYRAHAAEMKAKIPREPKFFLKPPSSLLAHEGTVVLPGDSRRVDYEVELAVIIGRRCKNLAETDVESAILGYTIMVDITARDLQQEAKSAGMPWTVAKGFDTFAPIGPQIVPASEFSSANAEIWLTVNGEYRQKSSTQWMIFSVNQLVSNISRIMTLEPHDVIATGTPEGVGPLSSGDEVVAGVTGIAPLSFRVEQAEIP
jgi:2-keto-4-pentenoate hydratase/2-oxohepta-3-ene-1,7-dioic acid hydratase in catechol pathway